MSIYLQLRSWLREHRFRMLFASFIALLAMAPFSTARGGSSVFAALFVANFLAAVYAAAPGRLLFRILVALAIAASVAHRVLPGDETAVARMCLSVLAYATLFIALMQHVLRARTVTAEEVFAALTGYMFLLLLWMSAYVLTERATPGAFHIPGGGIARDGDFLYFSIVTQSTLGYGDIHPVAPFARILAGLQAIFGQLYLAVLVARLVALQITTPQSPPADSGD